MDKLNLNPRQVSTLDLAWHGVDVFWSAIFGFGCMTEFFHWERWRPAGVAGDSAPRGDGETPALPVSTAGCLMRSLTLKHGIGAQSSPMKNSVVHLSASAAFLGLLCFLFLSRV